MLIGYSCNIDDTQNNNLYHFIIITYMSGNISERARRIAAEILAEPEDMKYGAGGEFFATHKKALIWGSGIFLATVIVVGGAYVIYKKTTKSS